MILLEPGRSLLPCTPGLKRDSGIVKIVPCGGSGDSNTAIAFCFSPLPQPGPNRFLDGLIHLGVARPCQLAKLRFGVISHQFQHRNRGTLPNYDVQIAIIPSNFPGVLRRAIVESDWELPVISPPRGSASGSPVLRPRAAHQTLRDAGLSSTCNANHPGHRAVTLNQGWPTL